MAILSQRLHRLGDNGYDIVHFETQSKLVLRPDGTDAETAFQKLESSLRGAVVIEYREDAPTTVTPGTIVIVGNSAYIANAVGVPLQIAGSTGTTDGPSLELGEV